MDHPRGNDAMRAIKEVQRRERVIVVEEDRLANTIIL
jgi:hypothetical protein